MAPKRFDDQGALISMPLGVNPLEELSDDEFVKSFIAWFENYPFIPGEMSLRAHANYAMAYLGQIYHRRTTLISVLETIG